MHFKKLLIHAMLQVQYGDGDVEELEDHEVMSALASGPRTHLILPGGLVGGPEEPSLVMHGSCVTVNFVEEGCWPCRVEEVWEHRETLRQFIFVREVRVNAPGFEVARALLLTWHLLTSSLG